MLGTVAYGDALRNLGATAWDGVHGRALEARRTDTDFRRRRGKVVEAVDMLGVLGESVEALARGASLQLPRALMSRVLSVIERRVYGNR